MKLLNPAGEPVEFPADTPRWLIENRIARGWKEPAPETAAEALSAPAPIGTEPAGQDDVAHAAASDPPPVTC